MKIRRLFLIAALIIMVLIAGAVIYVLTNLNPIVKRAIEHYGSEATKTAVSVDSVDIKLSSGQGSISGLTVANPPGFSTPDIFRLGRISVRIDVASVTKTPIVIREVRVTAPEVFYEMNRSGASNMNEILKNLQGPGGGPSKQPSGKGGGQETRLFIRRLTLYQGRVEVRVGPAGGKPVVLDLPKLEMTDIGKNGGATPTEVAKTVATALAEQTAKVVAQSEGKRLLRKEAEDLLKRYLGK